MMRTAQFAVIFPCIFLMLSAYGCGGGEEPPQKGIPAPSELRAKDEQKDIISEEETVAVSHSQEPPIETDVVVEASENRDEIVIENQGYAEDKKKPVGLNHKKHAEEYEIACNSCHHIYEDGKNVWKEGSPVKKCASCHDPIKDQGNVIKLQSAFHKNCRNCHREISQEGMEAPYKKCTECHR